MTRAGSAPGYRISVRAPRPGDEDDRRALERSTMGNALESEGLALDPAVVRRGVAALLDDSRKGRAFLAEAAEPAPSGDPASAATPRAGGPKEPEARMVGSTYVTFEWSDWHDAWYWWIQSVWVAPEWRGRGVYDALHRAVMAAAEQAGDVRSVRLYVERHNAPALAAYRRQGMAATPYEVLEQVVAQGRRPQG